jgi:hypothetical protein
LGETSISSRLTYVELLSKLLLGKSPVLWLAITDGSKDERSKKDARPPTT